MLSLVGNLRAHESIWLEYLPVQSLWNTKEIYPILDEKKMIFLHLIATKLQTMIIISLWIFNLKLAHHTENT